MRAIDGSPTTSAGEAARAVAVAERVAAACSRVLPGNLLSVILHGSLVLGDYLPRSSDVDLLAIVERRLLDREVAALCTVLTARARALPVRVDLRVTTLATALNPSPKPPLELYLRFGGGKSAVVEEYNPEEPDLAVELSICREHGRALHGAEPRAVIGEVPDSFVLMAGDRQVARWQSLTHDTAHAALMVLTACRVWRFSEEGRHASKRAAGSWALKRDPSLAAVRDALRCRGGRGVLIEPEEIARVLRVVRTRIAIGDQPRAHRDPGS
jgi:Domain of unknown function (DUF4111)/Nucleotidyltransferase domain